MDQENTLEIAVRPDQAGFFAPLLRAGVKMTCQTPVSALDFLCREAGLCRDYVLTRAGTVFVDGHPVDDLAGAMLRDGSRLAVGMASPGLAGISLGRGSPLAAFRADVSYTQAAGPQAAAKGTVTLKLFNMVALEAAASVLGRGFALPGEVLATAARSDPDGFGRAVLPLTRDGLVLPREAMAEALARAGMVRVAAAAG